MTIAQRIGIVGGAGWLGNAIASAAVASGTVDPARLTLSGRSDKPGAMPVAGAYLTKDNAELVDRSDVVVLSVRPDQFPVIDIDASGKLVISVMVGVPMRVLAARKGAAQVVRSIPTPPRASASRSRHGSRCRRCRRTTRDWCKPSSRPVATPPRSPRKTTSTIASG